MALHVSDVCELMCAVLNTIPTQYLNISYSYQRDSVLLCVCARARSTSLASLRVYSKIAITIIVLKVYRLESI